MKHWDLYPGETVTLVSPGGAKFRAEFVCRDTTHARFVVDGEPWEFVLFERDDGDLRRAVNPDAPRRERILRRWTIEGENRGTRHDWGPQEWEREGTTRAAIERRLCSACLEL